MENKKETKKEKIMQVIDVFFVMILCFVVLLVTMLFQNLAGVKEAGKEYVIQASTLVPVVVALAAYVTFLVKRSKKGKKFFGCSNYPDYDFVSWNEPVKDKCEECGSYMVLKYSKTKGKYVQCSNSECGNIKIIEEKEKDN